MINNNYGSQLLDSLYGYRVGETRGLEGTTTVHWYMFLKLLIITYLKLEIGITVTYGEEHSSFVMI